MKTGISPSSNPQKLHRPGQDSLAYVYTESAGEGKKAPLVMFCGGYRSDMNGTKALYLEEQCRSRGQAYIRFDYSGHGFSDGDFLDGTIGQWMQDAMDVLNHVASRQSVVLVGSSMGGWIALLLALRWKGSLKGLVGVAAAPDFTEEIYARLSADQKSALKEEGIIKADNDYSDQPYEFTYKLYLEAKNHMLLDKGHSVDFPIVLIQGRLDRDVPWQTAVNIQKSFSGSKVDIVYVEDGGHRLSRPEDLLLIDREVRKLSGLA